MIGDREVIVDDSIENPFRCPDCDVIDFRRGTDPKDIECSRCGRVLMRQCDGECGEEEHDML